MALFRTSDRPAAQPSVQSSARPPDRPLPSTRLTSRPPGLLADRSGRFRPKSVRVWTIRPSSAQIGGSVMCARASHCCAAAAIAEAAAPRSPSPAAQSPQAPGRGAALGGGAVGGAIGGRGSPKCPASSSKTSDWAWSKRAQLRPRLAELCRSRLKSGRSDQHRKHEPGIDQLGPESTRVVLNSIVDHVWPEGGQSRPTLARNPPTWG